MELSLIGTIKITLLKKLDNIGHIRVPMQRREDFLIKKKPPFKI